MSDARSQTLSQHGTVSAGATKIRGDGERRSSISSEYSEEVAKLSQGHSRFIVSDYLHLQVVSLSQSNGISCWAKTNKFFLPVVSNTL
jgi:hypothetical protein